MNPRLLSDIQIQIIEHVDGRLRTGKEIADELKLPLNGVYVSLSRMVQARFLKKSPFGAYSSTVFGRICANATRAYVATWKAGRVWTA